MNVQSDITCKRRMILNSAMELIREHGFHNAPMSMIAKHAGVACGTIYHYFESKDEVIKEIFREVNSDLAKNVFRERDSSVSFRDQLFAECRQLFDYYLDQPGVLHFLELYKNSPYFRQTVTERNIFVTNFIAFFEAGKEEGEIRDCHAEIFIPLVLGTVSSMAKIHIAGRHCYTGIHFDEVIELVWNGIRIIK